jgi:copper chaperone CopZ
VRSALLSVKGVTRAKVTLEHHEAVVTYDPGQSTIEDLIAAVNGADGGPFAYTATLKQPAGKRKP